MIRNSGLQPHQTWSDNALPEAARLRRGRGPTLRQAFLTLLCVTLMMPMNNTTAPALQAEIGPLHMYYVEIAWLVVLLAWSLQVLQRRVPLRIGPIGRWLTALWAWNAVGLAVGITQGRPIEFVLKDLRGSVYYLSYFVMASLLPIDAELPRQFARISITATSIGLLALVVGYSWFRDVIRAVVPSFEPGSHNAVWLLVALPTLLLLVGDRRQTSESRAWVLFNMATAVTFLAVNGSRSLTVGFAISAGLVLFMLMLRNPMRGVRATSWALGFIGAMLLAFVLARELGYTSSRAVYKLTTGLWTAAGWNSAWQTRVPDYVAAWHEIIASPIVGHGLGLQMQARMGSVTQGSIDNSWLTIWAKLGVVGVALYLGLWWTYWRRAIRAAGRQGNSEALQEAFVRAQAWVWPALLVFSFNISFLYDYQVLLAWGATMALIDYEASLPVAQRSQVVSRTVSSKLGVYA